MNGAAGTFVALLPVSVAFSSSAAVLLDDEASNSSFTIVVLLDSATASCFSMFFVSFAENSTLIKLSNELTIPFGPNFF